MDLLQVHIRRAKSDMMRHFPSHVASLEDYSVLSQQWDRARRRTVSSPERQESLQAELDIVERHVRLARDLYGLASGAAPPKVEALQEAWAKGCSRTRGPGVTGAAVAVAGKAARQEVVKLFRAYPAEGEVPLLLEMMDEDGMRKLKLSCAVATDRYKERITFP
jgi:hypothetical protein